MGQVTDNWAQGHAYERYMGRWSRQVASAFVGWLAPAPRMRWLDVGCGTGALTTAIIRSADPDLVVACDPARSFIEFARNNFDDSRASFAVAGIEDLPEIEGGYDAIVSGLVLNFLPAPGEALRSMMKRGRPGGLIAAYLWDYAGRMDFLRTFWEEAVTLDPGARDLDEGRRFPLSQANMLMELFASSGLSRVRQEGIEIRTRFANFADFWAPFEQGTGPAPGYVASLAPGQRARLQNRLRQRLTPKGDSPVEMVARAWAVSGRRG